MSSFSINVPSIKIPNSNSSHFHSPLYQSAISTPFSVTYPPSSPSSKYNDSGKYMDKYNQNIHDTPTSVSYTINAGYTPIATPHGKNEIICSTPNTINAAIRKHQGRHKRADHNKITTASLPMSITPLTPNPNIDLNDAYAFNFDVIDLTESKEEQKEQQQHLKTLTKSDGHNSGITDIDDEISECSPKLTHPIDAESAEQPPRHIQPSDDHMTPTKDEDESSEMRALSKNGYTKIDTITDTLQGCIFVAENDNVDEDHVHSKVVIKRTSKYLHSKGITIQNGKTYEVNENVLREYDVLNILSSAPNCPCQITKVLDFFETETNYYLVMEHGGADFFEFIVKAHQLINEKKLKVKEWRKFVKYMFYQIVVALHWLHHEMNCCHLDISLENITIQNGNFILQSDGTYTVDPQIRIKIVDFGLAEFFDPNDAFQCVKYCGKTTYKAPEIYRAKHVFDARRADVWSLGVVLFCMAVGSPPYVKPSNRDNAFKYYIKTGLIEKLLFQWNRHYCFTVKMLNLCKNMLRVDIQNRFLMENVLKHSWLNVYYKQYKITHAQQTPQTNFNSTIFQQLAIYKLPKKN